MGRSHILSLLAGVGITLVGPMTHDAVALATALESGQANALERFVKEYPYSPYRDEAIQLAKNDRGKGDKGKGDKGKGDKGKGDKGKGGKGKGGNDHGNDNEDGYLG